MAQNIYNYKPPKSGNDEVSYFLALGRITGKVFFMRLLLVIVLLMASNLVMEFYAKPEYQYWKKTGGGEVRNSIFLTTYNIFKKFNDIALPVMLGIFILIQGAKRIHDTNHSAWYIFVPFYNIVLLFSRGTKGNNDYGINPRPQKVAKYFDEIEEYHDKSGYEKRKENKIHKLKNDPSPKQHWRQ